MLLRGSASMSQSFVHISRTLRDGEMIPLPPSLIEQVLACRMDTTPVPCEEPEEDPEYWSLEPEDDEE